MTGMTERIASGFDTHLAVMADLRERAAEPLAQLAEAVVQSLSNGGKILLFGNGGSAADAQHIAAELVGRFRRERAALAAIALTTDTSALTAIANDYGYDRVFERQVEALAGPQDLVIGFSTSGNSANVLKGVARAAAMGCATAALTGNDGGKLGRQVHLHLNVPHTDTARIQEGHITLGHILCDCVEAAIVERGTR